MTKVKAKKAVKTIELEAAVRLKTINSKAYFDYISQEAYNLFDTPDAGEMVAKVFTGQIKEGQGFIPREFTERAQKLASKYSLTGGTTTVFLKGKIKFRDDGSQPILNDIIAEITLKDGIVDKIEKIRFPEPL